MAICILCGKEFIPKTKTAKICYEDHYKTCPVCGKSFLLNRNNYKQQTCSLECSRILRKKHAEETSLTKYGVKNAGWTKESQEKARETNQKRYGSDTYFSSDIAKVKNKKIWQEKYGVDNPQKSKDIQDKTKQTNLERYGATNPFGKNSWKRKEIDEHNLEVYGVKNLGGTEESKKKIKQTQFERYGTWYSSTDECRHKIQRTCQERYGVDSPFQSEQIKEKIQRTNLIRYGTEVPMKSEEVKAKVKATNNSKFGSDWFMGTSEFYEKSRISLKKHYGLDVTNVSQIPEIKNKTRKTNEEKYGTPAYTKSSDYREKTNLTCYSKYGVPWPCMTKKCRNSSPHTISKINEKFGELLTQNDIKYENEFCLNTYSYDFKISGSKILIEIDPSYTHSIFGDTIFSHIDTQYHKDKTNCAIKNNYKCIHVFDWDNWYKIIALIKNPKNKVFARKCKLIELDRKFAKSFYEKYHIQNYCNNLSINYGLVYDNKVIYAISFGDPRYNDNYEYEIVRMCSHPDYSIVGGASKLLHKFIYDYHPKSIISYCDIAKFTGLTYEKLNFKKIYSSNPSIHWSKNKVQYTDNLLRKLGADKLLGTDYGKGTNNQLIMLNEGFLPVPDCGQDTWIWKAEN